MLNGINREGLFSALRKQKSVHDLVAFFYMLTQEVNKIHALKVKNALKEDPSLVASNDAGTDELTEILDSVLQLSMNQISQAELRAHIVRSYIAVIFLENKVELLRDPQEKLSCSLELTKQSLELTKQSLKLAKQSLELQSLELTKQSLELKLLELTKQSLELSKQIELVGSSLACATVVQSLLLKTMLKDKTTKNDYDKIMAPIKKEYDDFVLLLQASPLKASPLKASTLETATLKPLEAAMLENKKQVCALPISKLADTSRCITCTQLIPLSKLNDALTQYYANATERNTFKRILCDYMVKNVKKITVAQNAIAERFNEQANKKNEDTQIMAIGMVLSTIHAMILSTKWTVGFLGGVDIYDSKGKVINTVPAGMANIVELIQKGQYQPLATLKAVEASVLNSEKSDSGISFFSMGKRNEKTQHAYINIKTYIKNYRKRLECSLNFHR